VTLVIPCSIGCRYFVPGQRLPSRFQSVNVHGRYQFILLGEQRQMCLNDLRRVAA